MGDRQTTTNKKILPQKNQFEFSARDVKIVVCYGSAETENGVVLVGVIEVAVEETSKAARLHLI